MSTIRVVNIQHTDATEPNIVLEADGTTVFASGITISGGTNLTVSGTAEFASGTVNAPGITFIDDNNTGIYSPGADQVAISTNGTGRLFIDSFGRIGIGKGNNSSYDSIAQNLLVADESGNAGITIRSGGGSPFGAIHFADGTSSNAEKRAGRIYYQHALDALVFSTADNEAMRIDSLGRLLLGTTTEGYAAYADNLTISDSGDCGMTIRSGTSNQGNIYFSDGTSGSDEYEGIIQYLHNDDAMAFGVNNGSERMRIDSSGNVGIGTSSPGANLEIKATSVPVIRLNQADTYYAPIKLAGNDLEIRGSSGRIEFYNGANDGDSSTEKMCIDSSGRVGINNSSPPATLSVESLAGNSTVGFFKSPTVNAYLQLGNSSSDQGYLGYQSSDMTFYTAAAEQMRIDSSGRLLVGTSSSLTDQPQRLQVEGTSFNTGGASLRRNSNDTGGTALRICKSRGTSNGSYSIVSSGDTLGIVQFCGADGTNDESAAEIRVQVDGTPGANDMPGRLVFSTTPDGASSPTERVRITDSGETFTFAATNGWNFRTGSSANTSNTILQGAYGATSTLSGTTSIFIYSNGDIKNTNNSYGGISDIKLKENIVDANSQWDDIKDLRVRNYNFIEGQTHTQIGVVAQEVETVSPGLVTESPDRDEEGNDLGTTTKSVNYSVLYMKAVKALQEAMERIETLEANNADLLARVSALEAN